MNAWEKELQDLIDSDPSLQRALKNDEEWAKRGRKDLYAWLQRQGFYNGGKYEN